MNRDTLEQDPCNTCGYEEGSIYCKEHCPHEAKREQEPCDKCVYSTKDGDCQYDDVTETIPPFEPCGDAIDRAEAIKVASGYCHPANVAKELAKLPAVNPQTCGDAIDRKLVCAFIDGLISDDREREKGLEYIRNMPPVNLQPCEDAISRQAALGCCRNEWEEEVEIRLKSLPSVNPTKTGHWIVTEDGFECSECGCISRSQADSCQYCGCRMIEPQERSDKE